MKLLIQTASINNDTFSLTEVCVWKQFMSEVWNLKSDLLNFDNLELESLPLTDGALPVEADDRTDCEPTNV